MYFNLEVFIYAIAISFQIAGALLLLFYNISTSRKYIVKEFAQKSIIIREENEILYNKEALKKCFKNAWINKIAFILIILGYILGVFGEIEEVNKILVVVLILMITSIVILISHLIVSFLIKILPSVNKELTDDEINEIGGEVDIETMSSKDVEDILNKLE